MGDIDKLKAALKLIEEARHIINNVDSLDYYAERLEINNLVNDVLYDIIEEINEINEIISV